MIVQIIILAVWRIFVQAAVPVAIPANLGRVDKRSTGPRRDFDGDGHVGRFGKQNWSEQAERGIFRVAHLAAPLAGIQR